MVNRKRVLRMMREDNPLVVQPRAFVVTTDSDHQFKIYLNLASRMKLTGIRRVITRRRNATLCKEPLRAERRRSLRFLYALATKK